MRTTLDLDERAVQAALSVAPGKSKTQIINEALFEYARRKRLRGLLDFAGKAPWEGDLDALRGRE